MGSCLSDPVDENIVIDAPVYKTPLVTKLEQENEPSSVTKSLDNRARTVHNAPKLEDVILCEPEIISKRLVYSFCFVNT